MLDLSQSNKQHDTVELNLAYIIIDKPINANSASALERVRFHFFARLAHKHQQLLCNKFLRL